VQRAGGRRAALEPPDRLLPGGEEAEPRAAVRQQRAGAALDAARDGFNGIDPAVDLRMVLEDAAHARSDTVSSGSLSEMRRRERRSATINMPTPSMIATSATLKTPVCNGPIPMTMKSTTLPRSRRSTQLDTPPAATRAAPTSSQPRQR